jgi:phosphonate transport system substrate-binding protein
MRRLSLAAAAAVGLLFAALLVPGLPLRAWFLSAVTGSAPFTGARRLSPRSRLMGPPLRIAIGAMISPERTLVFYGEFFAEMARRLGRPLELLQRRTYRETNDLIARGEVDLAWICTGAWPQLREEGAARLFAVPIVGGNTFYQSLLIVGPSSTATRFEDLRGKRFAFTDQLSLTGFLYPRSLVSPAGRDPSAYFSSTFFTHGHDLSIESVRRGIADGASVDSLIYDHLVRRFPSEVEGVRVIDRSPPFPIPPLVVPVRMPEVDARRLKDELIALSRAARGRSLLDELLIDGFAAPELNAYANVK